MITLNTAGKPVETIEKVVDVSLLEKEKTFLESSIADMPVLKTKPDEETLVFYNNFISRAIQFKERQKIRLADINKTLKEVSDLNG